MTMVRFSHVLSIAAAFLASRSVRTAQAVDCFFEESFDLEPDNPSAAYSLSASYDDGNFDYFGRYAVPSSGGGREFFQGPWTSDHAIFGNDQNGVADNGATQSIVIGDIAIDGMVSLYTRLSLGGGDETLFESEDGDGIEQPAPHSWLGEHPDRSSGLISEHAFEIGSRLRSE